MRNAEGKKCRLGEGGFGVVYKAIMNGVDEVAVKLVKADTPTPQEMAAFRKEVSQPPTPHSLLGGSFTDLSNTSRWSFGTLEQGESQKCLWERKVWHSAGYKALSRTTGALVAHALRINPAPLLGLGGDHWEIHALE